MQFHSPSVVQAVPAVMAEPVPVVPVLPVLAAVDEDATGVEAMALEATEATGVEEAAGAEVAWEAAPEDAGTVAKTPPVAAGDEEAATAAEVVAFEAAADVAEDPEPAVADAPPETAAPQPVPVGVARAVEVAVPSCSTESPGFGKRRSVESCVPQPLLMLATNMSGRASNAAVSRSISIVELPASNSSSSRFEEDAVSVTGAQFIYISRLPTLLNHVQARVAVPVGRDVGTVKE